MPSLPLKVLWLLAGAGTVLVTGQLVLAGRPRQDTLCEQLVALDSCLAASNQQRALVAARLVRSISYAVAENRNQAADVAVQRVAQRIQARAQALTDTLRWYRQRWPAAGTPAARTRLATQLRQYEDTIRQCMPDAAPLNQTAEVLPHQDWLNQPDLAALPRPVGVAALTRLEARVRQLSVQALQTQAEKVGSRGDWFARIEAVAVPTAETVAPGAVYEAKLLLATTGLRGQSVMRVNGQELPVGPRTGQIAFHLPAARPGQPDTVRAQWQGQVQFKYQLADTVLKVTVPYLIVKPAHP